MVERCICEAAMISQHNRFKCWRCQRKIAKGLPVLRRGETTSNYGYQTHSICHNCAEDMLKSDEETIKHLAETSKNVAEVFEKIKGECSKALVLDKITKGREEEEARIAYEEQRKKWDKEAEERSKQWEEEEKIRDEKKKQDIIDEYIKRKGKQNEELKKTKTH